MAMHNPQLPNREAVARIIDPGAYAGVERYREGSTPNQVMRARVEEALAKSDAILALIPSPDQGEAEYVTITLSRDGTVTSHNAFDADFDEMVVAIQTIVAALQARLEGRGRCPYSHGAVLRKEPLATPPVDSAKPGNIEEALTVLRKWEADTPMYEGDDPRSNHYRRNRKALNTAIAALSASLPEPQLGVDSERARN